MEAANLHFVFPLQRSTSSPRMRADFADFFSILIRVHRRNPRRMEVATFMLVTLSTSSPIEVSG
jgi:hypothetical protein